MSKDMKNLSPQLVQGVLRIYGMAHSSYLGNDLYFYLKGNQMIINDIGEEFVERELADEGKDWKKIKAEIQAMEKKILKAKRYYDWLEDKAFAKKDREERDKAEFIRIASKIPLMGNPILFMYGFLLRKTNLQRMTIPPEAFKILEHRGFRTMEVHKKQPTSSGGEVTTGTTTGNQSQS